MEKEVITFMEKEGKKIPIGAKSDNVYIVLKDENNNDEMICSLSDFFKEWQAFKEGVRLIQYKKTEPISDNIKIWYEDKTE